MRPTPHLPSGGGPHRKHPMLRPASKAALAAAQPPAAAERPRIRLSEREPAPAPIEEPEVADPDQGVDKMTQKLQSGIPSLGILGILRTLDAEGERLLPFKHQRDAAREVLDLSLTDEKTKFSFVVCHKAGLGKTATIMIMLALSHLKRQRQQQETLRIERGIATGDLDELKTLVPELGQIKVVILAPTPVLEQWTEHVHTWLSLPSGRTLMTNESKKITAQSIQDCRVLITSRHIVAGLFKTCHQYVEKCERNASGHWISKWMQKPGVALHPLFETAWSHLILDEVHLFRNCDSTWTVSCQRLAQQARFRWGLTATPVINRPTDMAGICKALNVPPDNKSGTLRDYRDPMAWLMDRCSKTINKRTSEAFRRHFMSVVDDDILNLPPIHSKIVRFEAQLDAVAAQAYNVCLHKTRSLKMELERNGQVSQEDLRRLAALLAENQQRLVSPELAQRGAAHFDAPEHPIHSVTATGALLEAMATIRQLRSEGHELITFASHTVQPMSFCAKFLQENMSAEELGDVFRYDGKHAKSIKHRRQIRTSFFASKRAILFLSVKAGGTGVHLVPRTGRGCCAMVFWGARSFSPADVYQTLKRIHRIGQKFPITVRHVIAYGSVDDSINRLHDDKRGLSRAMVEGDWATVGDGEEGGEWKKTGRIVEGCRELQATGNFEAELPRLVAERKLREDESNRKSVELYERRKQAKAHRSAAAASGSTSAPPPPTRNPLQPPVVAAVSAAEARRRGKRPAIVVDSVAALNGASACAFRRHRVS